MSKKPTLFDDVVAAGGKFGEDYDSHESDLYLRDTPEHRALMRKHEATGETFHSRTAGGFWVDIPFAYSPWWRKRVSS